MVYCRVLFNAAVCCNVLLLLLKVVVRRCGLSLFVADCSLRVVRCRCVSFAFVAV